MVCENVIGLDWHVEQQKKTDILWKWIPHVSINYVLLLTKLNFGRSAFIAVNNYIAAAHFRSSFI